MFCCSNHLKSKLDQDDISSWSYERWVFLQIWVWQSRICNDVLLLSFWVASVMLFCYNHLNKMSRDCNAHKIYHLRFLTAVFIQFSGWDTSELWAIFFYLLDMETYNFGHFLFHFICNWRNPTPIHILLLVSIVISLYHMFDNIWLLYLIIH